MGKFQRMFLKGNSDVLTSYFNDVGLCFAGLPSNSTPEISSHGYLLITQEEYRFNNYNFLNYQKNM